MGQSRSGDLLDQDADHAGTHSALSRGAGGGGRGVEGGRRAEVCLLESATILPAPTMYRDLHDTPPAHHTTSIRGDPKAINGGVLHKAIRLV